MQALVLLQNSIKQVRVCCVLNDVTLFYVHWMPINTAQQVADIPNDNLALQNSCHVRFTTWQKNFLNMKC